MADRKHVAQSPLSLQVAVSKTLAVCEATVDWPARYQPGSWCQVRERAQLWSARPGSDQRSHPSDLENYEQQYMLIFF